MLEGVILKGIGGFYYIDTERGVYECRARGIFRKEGIRPTVGDAVRNRAGLAGAGTGEHAHGPVELGGDRALVGVEARKDIVSGECVLRLRG